MLWNTGFDAHLYAGDLKLEDLKKVFSLGYYLSPFFAKVFKLGAWFNVEHLVPMPTHEFNQRVQAVETLEALKNVFSNSSNRGHFRFYINVMPYFKTGTIEFRLFNSSASFRETLETIQFMYRFLDFALTKTEEDYQQIKTEEDFYRVFRLRKDKIPDQHPPLLFAESHKEATRNIAKGFPPSRKIATAVLNSSGDRLALVNPFHYQTELGIYKLKQIVIYNNSEFNHIVYLLAVGDLAITYQEQFELLNGFKDGAFETELALFFIFARMQKYNIETEYGEREFTAHVAKLSESIAKLKPVSIELVAMFETVDYVQGTIETALQNEVAGTADVVYQQGFNSKDNSAVTSLRKFSDYETGFTPLDVTYGDEETYINQGVRLFVISKNDFLPYHKVARDLDTTLYCSEAMFRGVRQVAGDNVNTSVQTPPDDFRITATTPITIREVRPAFFSSLQPKFVKKVSKFKQPRITYVVMSGELMLGAFGFDYSKDEDYSMFLLSDFCTNNNVRLLSKFILFLIRSTEFKTMLERKLVERIETGYTKVYTTQPVSMKYRGAFKKVGRDEKSLTYSFEFGSMASITAAKQEYIRRTR